METRTDKDDLSCLMEPPRTPRYQVEGSIGVGGAAEVFRARDTLLGRAVALKRLLPEPDAPPGQAYAHALREATHLAALQHPHIVSVYDVDEDERGPYLIMELVEGDTLEEAVERGPFALGDFLLLARQSLDALAAAHHVGLLHRDLKPGNVMLKHGVAGKSFEVKLLDFGLSGFTGRRELMPGMESSLATHNQDDTVLGSVHFMAPEQFTREHPPDPRADLYALGCLLYYALTATYPVEGDTVGTVVERHLRGDVPRLAPRRPEVPDALCAWVMRLLSVLPADRPESAARALEELQGLREAAFDPARATSVPTSAAQRLASRGTARLTLPAIAPAAENRPVVRPTLRWWHWSMLGTGVALGALGGGMWGLSRSHLAPISPLPPPVRRESVPVLAATDSTALRANLGREIITEGRLLALEGSAGLTVLSLRFEPGTDGSALSLVFFAGAMPPGLAAEGLQAYVGHRVRTRGQLSEYRGAMQIIVRDAAQIEAAY